MPTNLMRFYGNVTFRKISRHQTQSNDTNELPHIDGIGIKFHIK